MVLPLPHRAPPEVADFPVREETTQVCVEQARQSGGCGLRSGANWEVGPLALKGIDGPRSCLACSGPSALLSAVCRALASLKLMSSGIAVGELGRYLCTQLTQEILTGLQKQIVPSYN
jgi:hypothetical protein